MKQQGKKIPLHRTMRFPLSGRARDLHPLDYAHVGRTKKNSRANEEFQ